MEEIAQLAKEVRELRIDLEGLRDQIVLERHTPLFTRRMLWALLVGVIILASSTIFIAFEVYSIFIETHKIHSLLIDMYGTNTSITD